MSDESTSQPETAKPAPKRTTASKAKTTAKPKTTTRKTTAAKKTAATKSSAKATASKPRTASKTAKKPASSAAKAIVPAQAAANDGEHQNLAEETKARASELANDAKDRISSAIANLGGLIADSADVIEERLGSRFGDIARSTSEGVNHTAQRIEDSDLNDLADDTREFIRKSPGLALGLAVTAGFVVARLFKSSSGPRD